MVVKYSVNNDSNDNLFDNIQKDNDLNSTLDSESTKLSYYIY
jgi:hypothetical protein